MGAFTNYVHKFLAFLDHLPLVDTVEGILLKSQGFKKREPERCHALARSQEHLNFFAFLELLRKIKKKLKLTALASQQSFNFWFSVSRNVLFCQENKNSNVDNFFPELDKNPPSSS